MDPNKTLYLVFSNPVEGRDEEFNAWYDEVHVHDVVSMPGVVSAQRYALFVAEINKVEGMEPPKQRYLTVYEMEGDVDATMAKIGEAVFSGTMGLSDAMDMTSSVMSYWNPRGPKVTKGEGQA